MLAPALVVTGITSAQATHVSSFEIDGDRPVNKGGTDWNSPLGTHVTDPTGDVDDSNFTQGSKEFEHPDTWVRGTGTAPNQDDISDAYTYTTTDHNGDVVTFFGFRRFTTTGVTNYDVEFNQAPNYDATVPRPTRTPGDLLLRFEQNGSDPFELEEAYVWTLLSDDDWGEGCYEVDGYDDPAGWCAIPITAGAFVGATGEDGRFAEGRLNLTALFGQDPDCRGAFGTMNIRSYTGESIQSSLKDFVAPIPISVPPTCYEPITITNEARATYDVAYDWSVEKNVDSNSQTVAVGTNATFTYRVLLTAGDEQRSGYELGGTVELTNPNGSPMVATLSVSATTGTGCSFPGVPDASPATAGFQVAVPDGTTSYVYTCTVSAPPASGTSTATVTWDETAYPSGDPAEDYTSSDDASYAFVVDQSTDEQTTVTDTFNGGAAEPLGTFTWAAVYNETDASTPAHTVVAGTYSRTITAGAAGACATYDNTGRQTENDSGQTSTSSETVTVCAPPAAPPPPAPPAPPAPIDVAPAEAAGSMAGALRGTCQGTVKVRMRNGFADSKRFTLKIAKRSTHYMVRGDSTRRVTTTAPGGARVVLKAGGEVIDRMRMPARCTAPIVLPATGLRATSS